MEYSKWLILGASMVNEWYGYTGGTVRSSGLSVSPRQIRQTELEEVKPARFRLELMAHDDAVPPNFYGSSNGGCFNHDVDADINTVSCRHGTVVR